MSDPSEDENPLGPVPAATQPSPQVVIDLPLDIQSSSERGLPWAFADEALDRGRLRPGAYLVAGDASEPVLVRVVEVDADDRVHVWPVGRGPFIPADLNLESDEPGVVWASVPPTGAPAVGALVLAGTAVAWAWTRVQAVREGLLLLELVNTSTAENGFVDITSAEVVDGYVVRLWWADGAIGEVDVEPYLTGAAGTPIRDPSVFAQLTVDPDAGTVVWPGGFDISPALLRRAATLTAEQGRQA
ncbi:Protein of unknown function [Klenkia soli]|uniref:DUF2442 domain-containing protein n=1 Tax=Klenkia soli TaxID=1052260 RepID=A0A1H0G8H0_9ACTN|nr:DUF2442 domain-containing protein [Klenkia soli]SDO03151.1 Protein of unknown function [Klenkia soli]